jgi:hypothetical protein
MSPSTSIDSDDLYAEEDLASVRTGSPPELFRRRKTAQRTRSRRVRRSQTHDSAKRGIHQRRNKRLAW